MSEEETKQDSTAFKQFVSNLEQDGAYMYVTMSIEKGMIDLKATPANVESGHFDRVFQAAMDFLVCYKELYGSEETPDKHKDRYREVDVG